MFTGIITDKGEIARVEDKGGMRRVLILSHYDTAKMALGASIACDGCCLTVVDRESGGFVVEISNETLDKTMLGNWKEGTKVNLEQSLKLGDEMGGHIVSGHVDGLATLDDVTRDGGSYRLSFSAPENLSRLIAPKGSVALAGISLTVNEVDGNRFGVNIIPHTWEVTSVNSWKPGDKINMEADLLARYVARIMEKDAA